MKTLADELGHSIYVYAWVTLYTSTPLHQK